MQRLDKVPGLRPTLSPDPNGCPFNRIEVEIDREATGRTSQWVREALLRNNPAVYIRIYHRDPGRFFINATEMSGEDISVLCDRIEGIFRKG